LAPNKACRRIWEAQGELVLWLFPVQQKFAVKKEGGTRKLAVSAFWTRVEGTLALTRACQLIFKTTAAMWYMIIEIDPSAVASTNTAPFLAGDKHYVFI